MCEVPCRCIAPPDMLSSGRSLTLFSSTNKQSLLDMVILYMVNVSKKQSFFLMSTDNILACLATLWFSVLLFYSINDIPRMVLEALQLVLMWHAECSTLQTISEDRDSNRIEQTVIFNLARQASSKELGLLLNLVLVAQNPVE